jgi:hypothetical protein
MPTTATVRLRNVSPLGHLDVPEIGRQGPAPHYGFCVTCTDDPTSEHEHELVDADDLAGEGEGCLKPGEVFEVSPDVAERLLAQEENFELAEPAHPRKVEKAVKKAVKKAVESDDEKGGESA